MDGILRRLVVGSVLTYAGFIAGPVWAYCGDSVADAWNGDCVLKREDTQVFGLIEGQMNEMDNQSHEFANDLKVWEKQWKNKLKLSGPANQFQQIAAAAAAGYSALGAAAAAATAYQEADPYNLRELMAPVRTLHCTVYLDPACQETVAPQTLLEIYEGIDEWNTLLNYQHLTLGYTRGDFADDIREVRAQFNELSQLSHTLPQQARQQLIDRTFPVYDDLLFVTNNIVAAADFTRAEWRTLARERSAVLQDTLRDTLSATRRNLERMTLPGPGGALSDLDQSRHYKDLVDFQIGRQQALENQAQQQSQVAESWAGLAELYLQQGSIYGAEYLNEEGEEEYSAAATIRHIEPTPFSNGNVSGANDAPFTYR